MKENFKLQSIFDKYCENKNSHVYLVETNSLDMAIQDILFLFKLINRESENIDKLIDSGNLSTLQLIEPDGQEIKIESINRLISSMQSIPVITKENYFIIKNAEKLNQKSGNSLLKLIEEPETEILGFFVCNNASKILPTIQSRTQLIYLNYDITENFDEDILNDSKLFLEKIHNGLTILDSKRICDKYKSLESMSYFINCLIHLQKKYINSLTSFDIINKECSIYKLIIELENVIKKNGNISLSFDSFVIKVGRLR